MMGLFAVYAPSVSNFYNTVVSLNMTGICSSKGPKHPNYLKHQQNELYKFMDPVQEEYQYFFQGYFQKWHK
jgi:hypothetical protein